MADTSFLKTIADAVGSEEKAIQFLLCLLAGYPLAIVYRSLIHGKSANTHHIFFMLTGLAVCAFNFGANVVHSLINITVIYGLLLVSPGSLLSVVFAFIFNTLYLLIGYLYNAESLSWTTPQCVITLRLTAIVVDLYDGKKKEEKLSNEQKETALKEVPSFLEMCGQAFFYGTFLAGPQFSMKRYKQFVNGEFNDPLHKGPPRSVVPALTKLSLGFVYFATCVVGEIKFPQEYMTTDEFYMNYNLLTRCGYMLLSGKLFFNRYIGTWLITEGVCILTGLSYNGKDENGNILWNGVQNVNLYMLETGTTMHEVMNGFNMQTNSWMARYIFKRLRFLGNKLISHSVTLFYLALWHGYNTGYFVNFMLEFFMINSENQWRQLSSKLPVYGSIDSVPFLQPLVWLIRRTFVMSCISYALISFGLLDWHLYHRAYASLYYIGHLIFIVFPLVVTLFARIPMSVTQSRQKDASKEKSTKAE